MNMIPFTWLYVACLFSVPAAASTGFHIGNGITKGHPSTYVISTGWYYPVEAATMANPKNVKKTAELFGKKGRALEWVSLYGSISQTLRALEFPFSGVNERGLMIQTTVLRGQSAPKVPAAGFGLDRLQWIQYHLDTSATVSEVIEKSTRLGSPIIPQGAINNQYQVCDQDDCAVISFFGDIAIAQGSLGLVESNFSTQSTKRDASKRWLLSAIANDTYANSMAAFEKCKSFPCPQKDEVLDRFIKAAEMVRHFDGTGIEYGLLMNKVFTEIKAADQGHPLTIWNMAFTYLPSRDGLFDVIFSYKTPSRPVTDRQWIRFKGLDFDCRKPTKMWWLNMNLAGGDRGSSAIEFTRAEQEKLIRQHSKMVSKQEIQAYSAYPAEKTKCLAKSPSN